MLSTEQINEVLDDALRASRQVKITFNRSVEVVDINYLLGMIESGIISIPPMDQFVLVAVVRSGDWEQDRNRTTIVTLNDSFQREWFVSRMRRPLETILLVGPKPRPVFEPVSCATCSEVLFTIDGDMQGCDCDMEEIISDLREMGYSDAEIDDRTGLFSLRRPDGTLVRQEYFMKELERVLTAD